VFSIKKGRVVILLAGRQAGKKAVVVKQTDDGKKVGILSLN
jgi:ribosomal protein L14E/L6E/L27E